MQSKKRFAFCLTVMIITVPAVSRENSSLMYRQGAALAAQGKYEEAIAVFTEVVKLSPYYCLGHYGLGRACLYSPGRLDDAVDHLRTATELDRRFSRAHFYLGMAYLLKGMYIPAIHAFDAAYASDDTYIEALYNIGAIYDIMDNAAKAKLYFRRYYKYKKREEGQIFF